MLIGGTRSRDDNKLWSSAGKTGNQNGVGAWNSPEGWVGHQQVVKAQRRAVLPGLDVGQV
jgi:hypothetical protein